MLIFYYSADLLCFMFFKCSSYETLVLFTSVGYLPHYTYKYLKIDTFTIISLYFSDL